MPLRLPRRKRWRVLGFFLLLLALSHLTRWIWPPHGTPQPGQIRLMVPVYYDDGEATGDKTPLYFLDERPANHSDAPVLVLLHGSPIAAQARAQLAQELAPDYRLIVPDLPGFGASVGADMPDYSLQTYAQQLKSLLDQLGVAHANFVGFGIGGGVALELSSLAPDRVQSIVLLNSIGPEEFEWLGDHGLNHALYGAQLGAITAARALLPHFGLLDTSPINFAYAHVYWDTNHSHLREALKAYTGPMLIIHSTSDFLAPIAAAKESYRIVPQSEIFEYAGGHWRGLQNPALVAPAIRDFIARADNGQALSRPQATRARIIAAGQDMPPAGPTSRTYEAILLFVIGFLTLFGEDAMCISTGLLVARGVLAFWPAALACFIGIILGNLSYYVSGWYFGPGVLKRAPFNWWIKDSDLRRLTESFNQRGTRLVFLSRFIPASRFPVYLCAGILRFSFWRMFTALFFSNLIVLPFVWVASVLGQGAIVLVEHYEKAAFLIIVAIVVVLLMVMHVVLPLATWRGRRLMLSRFRRIFHWEFWPSWFAQSPVLPRFLRLAYQYRSARLFTCANPGLPTGGFIGESKSALLRGLAGAGEMVARWTLLPAAPPETANPAADRVAAIEAWMMRENIVWPIVLKPDAGGQGRGVIICPQHEQARHHLADFPGAMIAQEFISGHDYELWYARAPGAPAGRLLAISDVRYPAVTGNGQNTLEHLILADDRAVGNARLFLAKHAGRLAHVFAAGEEFILADSGSVRQGAYFFDGTGELATPALTAAMDALIAQFPGFHFGRISVRCPYAMDLRAGHNWRVIGLSGVKAAGSAIRDSRHSLAASWPQTCRQWEICFEIAAANRALGARPAAWRDLIRGIFHSRFG